MTFWPPPNKFALARACGLPWSGVRPDWPKRLPWKNSDDARFGDAVSKIAQLLAVYGRDALQMVGQVAESSGVRGDAAKLRLSVYASNIADDLEGRADRVQWRAAEVPILYHVPSRTGRLAMAVDAQGRELGYDEDLARRPPAEHLGAILDLVEIRDHRLVVADYKSGFQQRQLLDVRTDEQLRAYALAAARAFGATEVRLEIRHVDENGVWCNRETDVTIVDGLELGIIHRQIVALLTSLPTATEPKPGTHCRRCPIVSVCPVTTNAIAKVVQEESEHPLVVARPEQITSPEHAASVIRRLRMIEEATPKLWAVVDAYVEAHGDIQLGESTYYGRVQRNGSENVYLDVPGAAAVVRKHLKDGAGWAKGVELVASKASLERGVKALLKETGSTATIKSTVEPLYGELRAIGAIKQGAPINTIQEFTVKPKKKKEEAA